MKPVINFYPIALVAIIGGALYFLSGNFFHTGNIDMTKYQQVCEQYVAAEPGKVSQEAMQSLVYKIDYLLPSPVNEITDPLEKSVKACSEKLKQRMANKAVK